MPEINEVEPNIYEVPRETEELHDAIEKRGTKSAPVFNEVGIDKKSNEVFSQIREIHKHDTESGMHHEAGMPLPIEAKSETEKAELINKVIYSGDMDPSDQVDFLKNLSNN